MSESPTEIRDDYIRGYFNSEGGGLAERRPALSKKASMVSLSNNSLVLPDMISNTKATLSVSLADGMSTLTTIDDDDDNDNDNGYDNDSGDEDRTIPAPLIDHHDLSQHVNGDFLYSTISNSTTKSSVPTLNFHSDSDEDAIGATIDELIRDDNQSVLGGKAQHAQALLAASFHSGKTEMNDFLDDMDLNIQEEHSDNTSDLDQFLHYNKHFFILSSAGKPIYSMHGSDEIISGYMGIIQTIMSYFKETNQDNLRSIVTSNNTRFTFYNQNPIILLAISTKNESDLQLVHQLQFLYNFLLLTLSKPHINRVFAKRENFDLRKLLGRSDIACLDSICNDLCNDLNPGLLIGGLEAIKVKLPIRRALDEIMLKNKTANLLYGLIVAPKGRLLTVLRPRRHTLHISDLQLLFEMIFNTKTFKTNTNDSYSEEEFWVPTCLPKFNSNGFLYSFIKFVDLRVYSEDKSIGSNWSDAQLEENKLAIILISADKSAFFEMRTAATKIIEDLISEKAIFDDFLNTLYTNRSRVTINIDIPTPLVRHFAYKSKNHIQYLFPEANFGNSANHAKLMFIYKRLQTLVLNHYNNNQSAKSNFISYLKFKISENKYVLGLVLITKNYELYVITNDGIINKEILMKSCKRIVKWCMKNQQRLFVCGGAVF